MPVSRWTRRRIALIAGAVLVAILALAVAAMALGGGADVVVYNGRSQYGDEPSFKEFEQQTGLKVELRGGTAPELYERLRREGSATDADLLVTTDLANLWRAKQAGLLEPVSAPALRDHVAPRLHDADNAWWGLSTRVRTPMRSTERVGAAAVKTYADLGKPQFKGRLCLRTSNNEYNQSLVADQIVKHGEAATEQLLRSWMANEPQVVGSDVDVLDAIRDGRCDVGLSNHYYLARELEDDPGFPVAPAWPDQDGAGAHTNLSGIGLVKGAAHRADAIRLMEFLTDRKAQETIVANGEFAANPDVPPAAHLTGWADIKTDPIDVARAGAALPQAVALMQRVGWE
jgi:iron(III) transport system substrate-binding protein